MSQLAFRNTTTRKFNPYAPGGPTFEVVDALGNSLVKKTGEEAIVASNPHEHRFDPSNRIKDLLIETNPDDPRSSSLKFKLIRKLKRMADDPNPTFVGSILNKGPLVGGASGAAVGFGLGTLGDWILDKINGGPRDSKVSLKLLGALSGGGMGTMLGHYRKKYNSSDPYSYFGTNDSDMISGHFDLVKRAAMYKDPRNFILEKIQGARDISFTEKAKLAAAVRSMDRANAEKLAKMVRSALGAGVGALIARYLFGMTSLRGTMFGGLVGLLGAGLYNKLKR